MRAIAQRVREAAVAVEGKGAGQIGIGLLVLAGLEEADQPDDLEWMAQKLVKLVGFVIMSVRLPARQGRPLQMPTAKHSQPAM
jgi:D-Tyr-tRNAtyr deacylase